jgi:hypothetical protein
VGATHLGLGLLSISCGAHGALAIWGPDAMRTLEAGIHSPLQVLQNDYIPHLGGLCRNVPASTLSAESCLPPLALPWLRASTSLWSRLMLARGGLLRAVFVAELQLTCATPPSAKRQPWSGSMLRMLEWLAQQGGRSGREVRAYLNGLTNTASHGPTALQRLHLPLGDYGFGAWDEALLSACEGAEVRGGATAEYAAHFAFHAAGRLEERLAEEPGFPWEMPYYFRHTGRFRAHTHARALTRLRCCSTPLKGCPSLHAGGARCPHCPQRPPETAHHVLFDCGATAHLRGSPAYAALFTPELLAAPRMRMWGHHAPQHLLAQYTHACFQIFQPSELLLRLNSHEPIFGS